MSTMFSSPVSIRLSLPTSRAAPPRPISAAERKPTSTRLEWVTLGRNTVSIGAGICQWRPGWVVGLTHWPKRTTTPCSSGSTR